MYMKQYSGSRLVLQFNSEMRRRSNRIVCWEQVVSNIGRSCAMHSIFCILLYFTFCILPGKVQAQSQNKSSLSESIVVVARPYQDSITLRWAPLTLSIWQKGNVQGYIIERYVMVRNGNVLNQPEKTIRTTIPLKPLSEDQWEAIVMKDKFAAIAAQALYGDQFEVDLKQSDVLSIVNKVRENEQRFAFALFSADMSPTTAQALGLLFTDKDVKKNEKYLYRIGVHTAIDSLKGSIFISPDDDYHLPKPLNLRADFKDQIVSLRWDKGIIGKYTAYIVERSGDGKTFSAVSDTPLVTVSPTEQEDNRYEYATDSLPDTSKTWYYRVRGITSFGELGSPSDSVSGKGSIAVNDVPYIIGTDNINNKSIRLTWEFPQKRNDAIRGFTIERSSKPSGDFISLTKDLTPTLSRSYEDHTPQQVNYYRVVAQAHTGERFVSPSYLTLLIDSIPPGKPIGLKASIDESGTVLLSWTPNTEEDIYGYRIYKANVSSEELKQVTYEPVNHSTFTDRVNLNTLNEAVYYSIMAIDRSQNNSSLSELLKVVLPDKVKPQPPVFLPVKSSSKGVELSWIRSSSEDVVRYDVYRNSGANEWQRLKMIEATDDTVYLFADEYSKPGKISSYTVTAIDKSGLESEPASSVNNSKIDNRLRPSIRWKEPVIVREKNLINLSWEYDLMGVQFYGIYKSMDGSEPTLYRSVAGDKFEFTDTLVTGKIFEYKIIAQFKDGSKSSLSKDLVIKY